MVLLSRPPKRVKGHAVLRLSGGGREFTVCVNSPGGGGAGWTSLGAVAVVRGTGWTLGVASGLLGLMGGAG